MTARNRTPEPPKVTAIAASEALDGMLANRPGWASTDRGWTHADTGITIEARAGTSPFHVTRNGHHHPLGTRAALELLLAGAGA